MALGGIAGGMVSGGFLFLVTVMVLLMTVVVILVVLVGGVQAEAESRDTQGPLTPENLALGASPGTQHLVSWTTYLVSLTLSFPISKGRLVLLAFLNCLGIRATKASGCSWSRGNLGRHMAVKL